MAPNGDRTPTLRAEAVGSGPILAGCPDYSHRFRTIQAAESWVAGIVSAGYCKLDHVVLDYDGNVWVR